MGGFGGWEPPWLWTFMEVRSVLLLPLLLPVNPVNPTNPDNPVKPANPNNPVNSVNMYHPVNPASPINPECPLKTHWVWDKGMPITLHQMNDMKWVWVSHLADEVPLTLNIDLRVPTGFYAVRCCRRSLYLSPSLDKLANPINECVCVLS